MTHDLNFSEYDPDWPSRFLQLRAIYLQELPTSSIIEHVGSTAALGLPSKDCIDVLVTVPAGYLESACTIISATNFEHRPASFAHDPMRHFFRLLGPQRQRIAHLHLMANGHPAAAEMIAVRDLLRRDREWRDRYAKVKRKLAKQFPGNRQRYISGKDTFVRDMTMVALQRERHTF